MSNGCDASSRSQKSGVCWGRTAPGLSRARSRTRARARSAGRAINAEPAGLRTTARRARAQARARWLCACETIWAVPNLPGIRTKKIECDASPVIQTAAALVRWRGGGPLRAAYGTGDVAADRRRSGQVAAQLAQLAGPPGEDHPPAAPTPIGKVISARSWRGEIVALVVPRARARPPRTRGGGSRAARLPRDGDCDCDHDYEQEIQYEASRCCGTACRPTAHCLNHRTGAAWFDFQSSSH